MNSFAKNNKNSSDQTATLIFSELFSNRMDSWYFFLHYRCVLCTFQIISISIFCNEFKHLLFNNNKRNGHFYLSLKPTPMRLI